MVTKLTARVLRAYARALNVAEPIRLRFWDDRGLTMTQLRLMFLLLERDAPTVGDLAAQMQVGATAITGLGDRLVASGLIERRVDEADRRVVRVALSSEGRRALSEIQVASAAYMERVLARLPEQRQRLLVELFDEFADAATAAQEDGEFPLQ